MKSISHTLLTVAGYIALGLGVAGIVTPLLPHTPFFLLAAYCFAQGSPRMHHWMRTNRITGASVTAWETNKALPRKTKVVAIATTILSMALSTLIVEHIALKLLLMFGAVGISVYIATRKE
jgi:uncharacterized membrane protein YbaN (DUF454 family)